jgi:hypothetical protein
MLNAAKKGQAAYKDTTGTSCSGGCFCVTKTLSSAAALLCNLQKRQKVCNLQILWRTNFCGEVINYLCTCLGQLEDREGGRLGGCALQAAGEGVEMEVAAHVLVLVFSGGYPG